MLTNLAKTALAADQPLFGCWLQLFSPVVGEMMGLCGYDVLLLDMEHGLGSVQGAAEMMRAIRGTGATAIVRVPSNDPVVIKTLMDQGVEGIMVPMIETAQAAQAVVSACRYPPKGTRGLAIGIARGSMYGLNESYVDDVDAKTMILCQIETMAGVRQAREIADVDGVDMIFIGRNDLAADSGHILDLDHPEVNALVDQVVAATRAAGKKVGTVPSAGRTAAQLFSEGFDLVLSSSDLSILRMAGQQEVAAFRQLIGRSAGGGPVARGY